MTWVEEHGPDEIYSKFTVTRNRTGEALPDDEFLFVLRPEYDKAAVAALYAYADAVEYRSPNLAAMIRTRLTLIVLDNTEITR